MNEDDDEWTALRASLRAESAHTRLDVVNGDLRGLKDAVSNLRVEIAKDAGVMKGELAKISTGLRVVAVVGTLVLGAVIGVIVELVVGQR